MTIFGPRPGDDSSHTAPGTRPVALPGPGLFVSFEGGDGAGKSTQLLRVASWLVEHAGRDVVRTREPGGTELGRLLRRAVLHGDEVDPRTEALLYAADRAHHVASLVRPALARGAVVLTDRYLDSSVAYQSGGRRLDADDVEQLSLWATGGLLPDLTVLLDVDPGEGLSRLTGDPDRLERAGDEFHARTRQAFLDRAAQDPRRWLVLDGAAPREEITAAVVARLGDLLRALPPPPNRIIAGASGSPVGPPWAGTP